MCNYERAKTKVTDACELTWPHTLTHLVIELQAGQSL